ncbi:nucleoside monophosphate kinase [Candidatus Parcubacteria bacterium]|nr:nucleoside monophosphate kinase [Candidatus Parcubacteria bacterium]
MSPKTIFFIGKPGCGKGTQAKLLAERTGWHIIAAGAAFREIASEDTPAGRKTKHDIDQGLLMPHWFAMYLYLKGLFSLPADASVIFDGFNRKEPEAKLIVESLNWLERPFVVLHIRVSDEEVRRRLELRKGAQDRADDHSVDTRLEEFETFTAKAIGLFREQGVLIDIDGEQTPEKIAEDVGKVLGLS